MDLNEISSPKNRGVSGGWAIAHPDFGRVEGAAASKGRRADCIMYYLPTQIKEATNAPEEYYRKKITGTAQFLTA